MTTPCPVSSSFPDQHDPLCDLPIHDVEELDLIHNISGGFGVLPPKTDLMDITSHVLKHEADREERQQMTLGGATSDVFPNFAITTFTARARGRTHQGNHSEVQQQMLATFGILAPHQQSLLPVTAHHGGSMRWGFVEEGAGQEADSSKSIVVIVTPSRYDILFGRGRAVMEHPGNLRLLLLVGEKMPSYNAANKEAKTGLTVAVVQILKGRSSRFLKKNDSGVWEEVTDALARNKVSHAFRTMRQSAMRNQEKKQTSTQGRQGAVAKNIMRLHEQPADSSAAAVVVVQDSQGKRSTARKQV